MAKVEYRVIPAPKRGKRGHGVKGAEARFAHAMEDVMNTMAADGWEYIRADTLPAEERVGLTSTVTKFQNLLVFRRVLEEVPALAAADPAPQPEPPLRLTHAVILPAVEPARDPDPAPELQPEPAPDPAAFFAAPRAEADPEDDGSDDLTIDLLRERARRLRKGTLAAE